MRALCCYKHPLEGSESPVRPSCPHPMIRSTEENIPMITTPYSPIISIKDMTEEIFTLFSAKSQQGSDQLHYHLTLNHKHYKWSWRFQEATDTEHLGYQVLQWMAIFFYLLLIIMSTGSLRVVHLSPALIPHHYQPPRLLAQITSQFHPMLL